MVSKEEFNKVFKDTSREGILNQFYYEHIELRKMIDNFNELEEELDRGYRDLFEHELVPGRELITNIKNYLQELKEKNKFNITHKPTFTTSSTSGNRPVPPKQTKGSDE